MPGAGPSGPHALASPSHGAETVSPHSMPRRWLAISSKLTRRSSSGFHAARDRASKTRDDGRNSVWEDCGAAAASLTCAWRFLGRHKPQSMKHTLAQHPYSCLSACMCQQNSACSQHADVLDCAADAARAFAVSRIAQLEPCAHLHCVGLIALQLLRAPSLVAEHRQHLPRLRRAACSTARFHRLCRG